MAEEAVPAGRMTGYEDVPTGQSKRPGEPPQGITSDIFGKRGGIFHPFFMIEGLFTDNLFTTASNEEEDFITMIAPGLWMALPANREKLLSIETNPKASGGLQLSRAKPEAVRRYQAYAMYSPELVLYADHSDHNHFNHNADALFQYNLNNGLSFDIIDVFRDKEDITDDGTYDTLYHYQSNLVDFITTYSPSRKLKLRVGYSNYDLDYKEDVNAYRDRMDNVFDLYVFYRVRPKTSLFLQYGYTCIDFDNNNIYDNQENKYYAGISWEMTAKSRGRFKVGYMEKKFDGAGVPDESGLSLELQAQHNLSAKRALQANAYRRFNEADTSSASSYFNTGMDVGLMQKFSEKWNATLNFKAERHDYNNNDREDDYFRMGPAVRYQPREWMFFDAAYYRTEKDSNLDVYDYTANTLILRMALSF